VGDSRSARRSAEVEIVELEIQDLGVNLIRWLRGSASDKAQLFRLDDRQSKGEAASGLECEE